MRPLRELLDRIRWDAEFGTGQFALAYHDRVAHRDVVVPFASIAVSPGGDSFSFEGDEGVAHIPLHRVHTVYKDGAVIWQRPRRGTP
jgi:uncharacterized protein (UPF0248 family)